MSNDALRNALIEMAMREEEGLPDPADVFAEGQEPNALTDGILNYDQQFGMVPRVQYAGEDNNIMGLWHPDDFPGGDESDFGKAHPQGHWKDYGPEPDYPKHLDPDLFATDSGALPPDGPTEGRLDVPFNDEPFLAEDDGVQDPDEDALSRALRARGTIATH